MTSDLEQSLVFGLALDGSGSELEPEAVTRALLTALNARRPRPRYAVTWPSKLFMFLARVLPCWALDYVKLMGIGMWPPGKKFHPKEKVP